MRGRAAFVLLIIAVIGTGCSSKGRLFTTEFSAIDGDPTGSLDIDRLPVALHDRTGWVTGVETSEVRPEDNERRDFTHGRAELAPDQPNAIRVLWLGGACEASVQMELTSVETGLQLKVHAPFDFFVFGIGCPAVGVSRSVVIGFDRPVDPGSIRIRTDID